MDLDKAVAAYKEAVSLQIDKTRPNEIQFAAIMPDGHVLRRGGTGGFEEMALQFHRDVMMYLTKVYKK